MLSHLAIGAPSQGCTRNTLHNHSQSKRIQRISLIRCFYFSGSVPSTMAASKRTYFLCHRASSQLVFVVLIFWYFFLFFSSVCFWGDGCRLAHGTAFDSMPRFIGLPYYFRFFDFSIFLFCPLARFALWPNCLPPPAAGFVFILWIPCWHRKIHGRKVSIPFAKRDDDNCSPPL